MVEGFIRQEIHNINLGLPPGGGPGGLLDKLEIIIARKKYLCGIKQHILHRALPALHN